MTATNEKNARRGNYSEGISIETSKVIQGMSLVFTGALTMLEAIHPKISVEPAELMCLMTGDKDGLMRLAEMRKAEEATKTKETEEEKDANETAADGTVDAVPDSDVAGDDAGIDAAEVKEAPAEMVAEAPTTTLTVDDITKVIVQKIKQNRSNNEKIGQFLKVHGVSKVSELPASKFEAFLTDLSAI